MSSFFTPVPNQSYNFFDRFGAVLGLTRLENERNAEYKQRLNDVFVHRSNSTYRGLINGITRELGLKLFKPMKITQISGNPVITFLETKCFVYSDYSLGDAGLVATFDRFEYKDGNYSIQALADNINATGLFNVQVDPSYQYKRSMCIFNQSNLNLVADEDINKSGGVIKLANNNLVPNSITIRSSNLTVRVDDPDKVRASGEYFIDTQAGIIYTATAPEGGAGIRYQHISNVYKAVASPVIIHDLQSDDFKTKMFEQILSEQDDTFSNGAPTELGASIINELLSVYPTSFGV